MMTWKFAAEIDIEIMKNGFVMVRWWYGRNKSDEIVSLEEQLSELEKCKDKKYLEKRIRLFKHLIENNKIFEELKRYERK